MVNIKHLTSFNAPLYPTWKMIIWYIWFKIYILSLSWFFIVTFRWHVVTAMNAIRIVSYLEQVMLKLPRFLYQLLNQFKLQLWRFLFFLLEQVRLKIPRLLFQLLLIVRTTLSAANIWFPHCTENEVFL